ncbi:MAG TPA: hypothetical protein VF075_03575 [Pyrinomonadaceae bacterium]
MQPTSPEAQAELTRRHKAAATTVMGLLVASILLCVIAFLGRPYLRQQANPPLDGAIRIAIFCLFVGGIIWRRTRFATMRLQDIAGVAGVSGFLQTLEKTTIQVALFGAGITACGFVTTLVTGNDLYTYWAAAIGVILFIYSYPKKSSWLRALYRFTEPQT